MGVRGLSLTIIVIEILPMPVELIEHSILARGILLLRVQSMIRSSLTSYDGLICMIFWAGSVRRGIRARKSDDYIGRCAVHEDAMICSSVR